jgi:hypothetical protein
LKKRKKGKKGKKYKKKKEKRVITGGLSISTSFGTIGRGREERKRVMLYVG